MLWIKIGWKTNTFSTKYCRSSWLFPVAVHDGHMDVCKYGHTHAHTASRHNTVQLRRNSIKCTLTMISLAETTLIIFS